MKTSKITRRNFVKQASLGTILIGLHPEICNTETGFDSKNNIGIDLIESIRLLTSVPLVEMIAFYNQKLGLPILEEYENEVSFIVGKSTLTFLYIPPEEGSPWYHFAFNIPENKLLKARAWQLQRTALIPTPKHLRDPLFPPDVRHFKNWNAHSVFFWDPAGNLLEYIARHELENGTEGAFTVKDLLNISEIGFVVDDQEDLAKSLNKQLELEVYPQNANYWWAMGDANGLLLAIPKRLWGENTDNPKRFGVHKTVATIRGMNDRTFTYGDFPYTVKVTTSH